MSMATKSESFLNSMYAEYIKEYRRPPQKALQLKAYCKEKGVTVSYRECVEFLKDQSVGAVSTNRGDIKSDVTSKTKPKYKISSKKTVKKTFKGQRIGDSKMRSSFKEQGPDGYAHPILKKQYAVYIEENGKPPKNAGQFQTFAKLNGVSLSYKQFAQFLRNPTMSEVVSKPATASAPFTVAAEQKHIPYLNAKQLTVLCRKEIIPKMKSMDPKSYDLLNQKKYRKIIETVLVAHDIDSFQVCRIAAGSFAGRMQKVAGTKKVTFPASMMWKTLQKEIKTMGGTLQWEHIVNAVRHELSTQIADKVAEVISLLGPLMSSSGDDLRFAINSKTNRTLTESEAQYLRYLIVRATKEISLNSLNEEGSVIFYYVICVYVFRGCTSRKYYQIPNNHIYQNVAHENYMVVWLTNAEHLDRIPNLRLVHPFN